MLGSNPTCKDPHKICRHFIVVFLFPIKKERVVTHPPYFFWCLIQTIGKVSKETEEGSNGRETFLTSFDLKPAQRGKPADYLQAVSVVFMVLQFRL